MKYDVFISGIGFLCFAIIDFCGFTFHLQKKYRTNQHILDSRKTVAALNLIIGVAGICYSFFTDITSSLAVFVALITLAAFIIKTVYVWHVMKKVDCTEK